MAGWLGANFTTQLDQLKKGVSQVSNIVKDTLVVDESWDREEGPVDSHEKINDTFLSNPDLNTEAGRLKELYKVSKAVCIILTFNCNFYTQLMTMVTCSMGGGHMRTKI